MRYVNLLRGRTTRTVIIPAILLLGTALFIVSPAVRGDGKTHDEIYLHLTTGSPATATAKASLKARDRHTYLVPTMHGGKKITVTVAARGKNAKNARLFVFPKNDADGEWGHSFTVTQEKGKELPFVVENQGGKTVSYILWVKAR